MPGCGPGGTRSSGPFRPPADGRSPLVGDPTVAPGSRAPPLAALSAPPARPAVPARRLLPPGVEADEEKEERTVYQTGDYVYPADLPRRWLCRVARADSARAADGAFQILTLEPLEGPWRSWPETQLVVRFDQDVLPALVRDLWTSHGVAGTEESIPACPTAR